MDNSTLNNPFFDKEVKECIETPRGREHLTPKQVILSLLRVRAWKQTQLADKIGLSRQALNNYISGRWGVPTQIKIMISRVLQVDSSAIWDLEGKK